jgi:hypothetical protein
LGKKKIKLKFATRAEKRNSVNFGKFGGDLPGIFLYKDLLTAGLPVNGKT